MTLTIVRRLFPRLLLDRVALHICSCAVGALNELRLFLTPTGISYVEGSAHRETWKSLDVDITLTTHFC